METQMETQMEIQMKKSNKINTIEFSKYITPDATYDNCICQTIWKLIQPNYNHKPEFILKSLQSYSIVSVCLHIMIIMSGVGYNMFEADDLKYYIKTLLDIIKLIKSNLSECSVEWSILNNLSSVYNNLLLVHEENIKVSELCKKTEKNDSHDNHDSHDRHDTDVTDVTDVTDDIFSDIVKPLICSIIDDENALSGINMMNVLNKLYEEIKIGEKKTETIFGKYGDLELLHQLDYTVRDAVCLSRGMVVVASKSVRYILINTKKLGIYQVPKNDAITVSKRRRNRNIDTNDSEL